MGRARRRARNFTLGESIFFIPFPPGFLPTTLQSAVGLLFIQIIHHAQMGFIFSSFLSFSLFQSRVYIPLRIYSWTNGHCPLIE